MKTLIILLMACMASMLAFGQTDTNIAASAGGLQYLEPGQPPMMFTGSVEGVQRAREANLAPADVNLYYHGGRSGIGVETSPQIYVVFWGKQWHSDPSNEATILQNYLAGIGGSVWLNSVTQYCQGVDLGTEFCNGLGDPIINAPGMLKGVWFDNATNAPRAPTLADIGNEATRLAAHFGNTTPESNVNAQYWVATSKGNNTPGSDSWCAVSTWWGGGDYGYVSWVDFPYITDFGAHCGANFDGLGSKAGITIVASNQVARIITDQLQPTGWVDSGNAGNTDKCAWISTGQGAVQNVTFSTGTFPVQSLWSNAFNSNAGGCVMSYP